MPPPVYEEFSPLVGFRTQLDADVAGPIVLVNVFTVALEDREKMKATWEADAAVMKQQPGFISAQLHEGVAESGVFMNYAVWESKSHLQSAVSTRPFRRL
jgi:heme-degrading monooxygenase HmoA